MGTTTTTTAALLRTRPAVRTVELLAGGTYTLVEIVGGERVQVVDTLLPAGADGVRPCDLPAWDVRTWAVYAEAEAEAGPRTRGAQKLLGYVMEFALSAYARRGFWAEYVSEIQGDICHAGHEGTMIRAVAAVVRGISNEEFTLRKTYEAEARASRAADVEAYDDLDALGY